ncbi:MAG: sulfotransferase [Anaerolineaceae bacterium]|nr:sulfotransferase [Anaerolineaceae bacterium]
MFFFNFKLFFRFLYVTFFNTRGHYRLTARRFFKAGLVIFLYIQVELVTWFSFLLDEIFYPGYRKQEIKEPIFILGNYRSGTTFMQRIISEDEESFSLFTTWEIVIGSSVILRKLVWGISRIDLLIGKPLHRILELFEKRTMGQVDFHHLKLKSYEEDETLFMHNFASFGLWLYSVPLELLKPYMRFDEEISLEERERLMTFYKRCIQRHLYAHGGEKRFLSKNPAFSSKIEALLEYFPDAKFIYLIRDPMEVVPSQLNMLAFGWQLLADPLVEYPFVEESMEMAAHFYQYPLKKLAELPSDVYKIIEYGNLVGDPTGTVREIYEHFDMQISTDYEAVLLKEAEKARKHRVKKYPWKRMGISQRRIFKRFGNVYRRFKFGLSDKQIRNLG